MIKRNTVTLILAVCCALCIFALGSEGQQQPAVMTESPQPLPAKVEEPTEEPVTEDKSNAPEEKPEEVQETSEEKTLTGQFELPYPDRVNMFQAPQRPGRGILRSNGMSEMEIELLGFVNVGGQQVVLSVDGMVASLSEGSKEFGIEVVSIQPPAVVLKQGRQRRQVSLDY